MQRSLSVQIAYHIFSLFLLFFPFLSTAIRKEKEKNTRKETQVTMTPLAVLPGVAACHKSALLLFL